MFERMKSRISRDEIQNKDNKEGPKMIYEIQQFSGQMDEMFLSVYDYCVSEFRVSNVVCKNN